MSDLVEFSPKRLWLNALKSANYDECPKVEWLPEILLCLPIDIFPDETSITTSGWISIQCRLIALDTQQEKVKKMYFLITIAGNVSVTR